MAITGEQLVALMIHLSWLSLLLLAGKWIRARLRSVQRLFLPASIIGGFLGLALAFASGWLRRSRPHARVERGV